MLACVRSVNNASTVIAGAGGTAHWLEHSTAQQGLPHVVVETRLP